MNPLKATDCPFKVVKVVGVMLCVYFSTMKRLEKNSSANLEKLEPFHFNYIFKFWTVQITSFL